MTKEENQYEGSPDNRDFEEDKTQKRKRSLSVSSENPGSPEAVKKTKGESDKKYEPENPSPRVEKSKSEDVKVFPTIAVPSMSHTAYHHPTTPSSSGGANIISETPDSMLMEIPPDKVGQVIGSKGMVIQDVQNRSGAKAIVNQDFPPGVNRQIQLTGTTQQMRMAADLIKKIVIDGPTAVHVNSMSGGPQITTVVDCPAPHVGKIIGSNGATIKEIQSKSGAKIQIDQNFPPNMPRKIHISGTSLAVNTAVQLVHNLLASGSFVGNTGMSGTTTGSKPAAAPAPSHYQTPYQQQTPYAAPQMAPVPTATPGMGEISHTMDVPKAIVGRIIGKAGETIQILQRKSGCRVKVDQQVPDGFPCKVNMTGTPQTIGIATQLIQEIMMGVPTNKIGENLPNLPQAGPPAGQQMQSAYGGMPQYGMPSPYGGMQMTQQPQFNYGYPPQMQYAQPYGMPAPAAQGYNPYGHQAAPHMQPGAATGYPSMAQPAPVETKPATSYGGGNTNNMGRSTSTASSHHAPLASNKPASVWTEHKTDEGIPYWYNSTTGVSQWEKPAQM